MLIPTAVWAKTCFQSFRWWVQGPNGGYHAPDVGDEGHPVLIVSGTDAFSNVIDILDDLVFGPLNLEIETEFAMLLARQR